MIRVSKEQVIRLHKKLLDKTGGSDGIRDESLLDSALSASFQTFDGIDLYPSVVAKISRIVYGLVCNHPFVDGNKRIGTYVMMALLELNHVRVDFTDIDIMHIGFCLASGKMTDKQLLEYILERSE